MMRFHQRIVFPTRIFVALLLVFCNSLINHGQQTSPQFDADVSVRYRELVTEDAPDFQRHVVPLLSRLGCNGRACHGSFQGRGGFQLSLFGYDFDADYRELLESGAGRVDTEDIAESLVLSKPAGRESHGGGELIAEGSWEYNLLQAWITAGASPPAGDVRGPLGGTDSKEADRSIADQLAKLVRLEVSPPEVLFSHSLAAEELESVQLQAIAVWADGSREDVTPLCRFQSNDEQIATVDENGTVKSGAAGDSHIVVFYDKAVVPVPVLRPVNAQYGDAYPDVPAPTAVDKLVVEKLKKLGVRPSGLCDDATFLRRVSLDLTGTLPSSDEIEAFVADTSAGKRRKKIDELMESDAYAAWWATKFCDFTGNSARQLNNAGVNSALASRQWFQWIYTRVQDNVPYDEMVAGIVLAESREEGESYLEYCQNMSEICRDGTGVAFGEQRETMPYFWMRREFRDGNSRAISFSHAFLGIRIQCAQCHKHPFDQWTKKDFRGFAQLFTSLNQVDPRRNKDDKRDWDEVVQAAGIDPAARPNQIRRGLPQLLRQGKTIPFNQFVVTNPRPVDPEDARRRRRNQVRGYTGKVLGGEPIQIDGSFDPRGPILDWLRSADNPYFARALVNRVWANYFNTGIVSPTDDLNLANPPSNAALLDYLSDGFVESGFDLKWLHREIANSRTYQLDWRTNQTNRLDKTNFSHAVPRRLPAEVVHDMLIHATGNDELLASARHQLGNRAIAGQIPLNARRNQGKSINSNFILQIFGASPRENSCDCDRASDPSLLQTVFLKNDRDIHTLIDRDNGWLAQLVAEHGPSAEAREISASIERRERQLRSLRQRKRQQDQTEKQLKQIGLRITQIEKQIRELRVELNRLRQHNQVDVETFGQAIRQAYLRTLSREPEPEELARCLEYIENDAGPVNAMRGILWSLLNTREFITNH